ncbi:MAG TPA: biotin carboxylase N-terminal domain-containing protein [Caulobacteraceae bacterium]|jgi:3-methylcrotonyl-CoA carboxylase alpha subunit|nr:biotin carboxylase N-terminal domain-containing protein [Caulobacteraceae bacterium]
MIGSVLIANRGEIACRVIRTARRLGLRTVAVHSDADAKALHVREADEAVRIGPAPARQSYLDTEAILEAARRTGAEAIHPGYGFLSENAGFAEAVIAAGLIWVGAPPAAIRAMGLKDAAKRLMIEAGVPVTPGYLGDDQSPERLAREAEAIGWPVLIKAVAGGGGKGMRAVHAAADFAAALDGAKREGAAAFGDDRVLIEKLIASPRHIEVQVFGDTHGNVVHLFERDCSLQRRHQKVIEEAPAPGMDETTRAALTDAAVRAARQVGYVGAGTIEFIADGSQGLRADRIWFMEMNTRLQVEHPVTEAITGLDLVEWQLRVAAGEPLPLRQDEIRLTGWAMEARLYAEDPANGFLPSTGRLDRLRLPDDEVRVDTGVDEGDAITPFYDPMIAKLIAHAADRTSAAAALAHAAASVEVWPVRTNAAFLAACLADEDFVAGRIDTGFIEARLEGLTSTAKLDPPPAAVGALAPWSPGGGDGVWAFGRGPSSFRLNAASAQSAAIEVDGAVRELPFEEDGVGRWLPLGEHPPQVVAFVRGAALRLTLPGTARAGGGAVAGDGTIRTPMPGRIVKVLVAQGGAVAKGDPLVVLEAMKMEHALAAPFDGVVAELFAVEGAQLAEGVVVARLEAAGEAA